MGWIGGGDPDFVERRGGSARWEDHLEDGESLRWTGAPSPRLHFKWKYAFTTPMGLLMMVGAVWAVADAGREGSAAWEDRRMWQVFGPLMFALGAFAAALPLVDAWARGRQKYALTDRRALIRIDNFLSRLTRSWRIRGDQDVRLIDGRLGSVRFATVRVGGISIPIAFEFIPDAAEVHRMLCAIRDDAGRAR